MTDQSTWFKAATDGDAQALKQLLDQGADVNAKDGSENTALHLATRQGHQDIMHLLIERGADVNAQNDYLSTPLHLTARNIESIRMLLEAGADPNITDKEHCQPYYFAFYGAMSRELTELYIKHGANLMLYPE